jgi:hypothetical protein
MSEGLRTTFKHTFGNSPIPCNNAKNSTHSEGHLHSVPAIELLNQPYYPLHGEHAPHHWIFSTAIRTA